VIAFTMTGVGMSALQAGEKVLNLEWLRERSAEEARAYLMSIDGVQSASGILYVWIGVAALQRCAACMYLWQCGRRG